MCGAELRFAWCLLFGTEARYPKAVCPLFSPSHCIAVFASVAVLLCVLHKLVIIWKGCRRVGPQTRACERCCHREAQHWCKPCLLCTEPQCLWLSLIWVLGAALLLRCCVPEDLLLAM